MPFVRVGDAKCQVTWREYFAAILPSNTPVEWAEGDIAGTGIFVHPSFYDGINAHIDLGGGKTKTLFLNFPGCRLRRLRDPRRFYVGQADAHRPESSL